MKAVPSAAHLRLRYGPADRREGSDELNEARSLFPSKRVPADIREGPSDRVGEIAGAVIQESERRVEYVVDCGAAIAEGQDRKGRVEVGYEADLILFDESFKIEKTIIGGEIIYDRK